MIGHAKVVTLRSYRPTNNDQLLPIVVYFHGGGFTHGCLDDATIAATEIASLTPAWVISVGYSLAPAYPFPAALEDGVRAIHWAFLNAKHWGADSKRIAVAGHDAGGNLATCVAAAVRDRGESTILAQGLLAPLLDPSMTRVAGNCEVQLTHRDARDCARDYRAYLPNAMARMHPYAAPIESVRLKGLPPAFIAAPQHDAFYPEAERYAVKLKEAGVLAEILARSRLTHSELAKNLVVLRALSVFFRRHLRASVRKRTRA